MRYLIALTILSWTPDPDPTPLNTVLVHGIEADLWRSIAAEGVSDGPRV